MKEEHFEFLSLSYPKPVLSFDGFLLLKMLSKIFELFSNFVLMVSSSSFFLSKVTSSSIFLVFCILSLILSLMVYWSSSLFISFLRLANCYLNLSPSSMWSSNIFISFLKLATFLFSLSASSMLAVICCLAMYSSSHRVLTSSSFEFFFSLYFKIFSSKDLFSLPIFLNFSKELMSYVSKFTSLSTSELSFEVFVIVPMNIFSLYSVISSLSYLQITRFVCVISSFE